MDVDSSDNECTIPVEYYNPSRLWRKRPEPLDANESKTSNASLGPTHGFEASRLPIIGVPAHICGFYNHFDYRLGVSARNTLVHLLGLLRLYSIVLFRQK